MTVVVQKNFCLGTSILAFKSSMLAFWLPCWTTMAQPFSKVAQECSLVGITPQVVKVSILDPRNYESVQADSGEKKCQESVQSEHAGTGVPIGTWNWICALFALFVRFCALFARFCATKRIQFSPLDPAHIEFLQKRPQISFGILCPTRSSHVYVVGFPDVFRDCHLSAQTELLGLNPLQTS